MQMHDLPVAVSGTLVDQLVDEARARIDQRLWRPGARLPSIRELAQSRKVSRFTVVEAYDRLVALGLVEARRGSGFFVRKPAQRATRAATLPAVGSDIGCGMAAACFDVPAAEITADDRVGPDLLARLARAVPALMGEPGGVPERLAGDVAPEHLSDERLARAASREGRWQLGSLGRGNHFLELQADQAGALWVMVHTGSRGMGQAISALHLSRAVPPADGALPALDAAGAAGRAYLADVAWARAWARANRRRIVDVTADVLADLLGATLDRGTILDCDHNHVAAERHGDLEAFVHRKGALPAAEGQRGLVPGSMGTASFHTVGRGHSDSLLSSSHGAGRVLPRGEAAARIDARRLVREMHGVIFDAKRAGRMVDEAPSAYRDIRAVMRAQRDLTRIERELRPILSYKGT